MNEHRPPARGIPLRAFVPNAITALALCFGLTGVRFAIGEEWEKALLAVVFAGVLDAMDGRIARLLRAQSQFGAELDSLSDVIAFGVAPSVIIFLWSLHDAPKFGWIAALALAVCCALRLARFNSRMDAEEQPHKAAGFYTGIPAPVGAGLAFVPIYLWFVTRQPAVPRLVRRHAVDVVHRLADDFEPSRPTAGRRSAFAVRGGCWRLPGSACSARRW